MSVQVGDMAETCLCLRRVRGAAGKNDSAFGSDPHYSFLGSQGPQPLLGAEAICPSPNSQGRCAELCFSVPWFPARRPWPAWLPSPQGPSPHTSLSLGREPVGTFSTVGWWGGRDPWPRGWQAVCPAPGPPQPAPAKALRCHLWGIARLAGASIPGHEPKSAQPGLEEGLGPAGEPQGGGTPCALESS